MKLKRYDLYGGIFWLVLGLLICGISLWDLGLGSFAHPEPGMAPFLVGALLLCTSLVMIALARPRRKRKIALEGGMPSFGMNVPITIAVLLVYALVLESLGYLISTSLLLLYLFKYSASRNWWMSVLLTAVVMVISYYFFVVLLQSQLPKGILE
jgi:putative tricarboxylic transport membrane protein